MEIINAHPKPKKKKWTVSESTLDKLWSKAVHTKYHNRCAICYKDGAHAHHIIGRRVRVLRWDILNGILLCVECHKRAHEQSLRFRELTGGMVDYGHLADNQMTLKAYCKRHSLSADEFRLQKRRELERGKQIIT